MDAWAVGVTTAPRAKPTLERTLRSITRAGWENPRVFADGDCPVPEGFATTTRTPAAGAFGNWYLSLHELVCRHPRAKWCAMFQDDIVLCRGAREAVERSGLTGVVSLYQSAHHASDKTQEFRGGGRFTGACALAFPADVAKRLIYSSFGRDHRLRQNRDNDYIDGGVAAWCKSNGVPLWIIGPSMVAHTGETSTLGHKEKGSMTFPGEDFDANAILPAKAEPASFGSGRIGLVGYNTSQGVGHVNRDIVRFVGVDKWLIVQHKLYPNLPNMSETECLECGPKTQESSIREWMKGLDIVLFVESPVLLDVPKIARDMGIKTVCVPMVESLPRGGGSAYVDLWLAPTAYSERRLSELGVKGRIQCYPWPIDAAQFPFRPRTRCERYVYAHGNGGPRDRKGGKIVAAAARMAPDIPITIYSQARRKIHGRRWLYIDWPKTIDFRGPAQSPSDIYQDGDVFILPSRWEGLGLQLFECQAAGMPLITTNAPPMDESNPWKFLPCKQESYRVSYEFPSFNVDPGDLVTAMRENIGADISEASVSAHRWVVENRDWGNHAEAIRSLIING